MGVLPRLQAVTVLPDNMDCSMSVAGGLMKPVAVALTLHFVGVLLRKCWRPFATNVLANVWRRQTAVVFKPSA